VSYFYLAYGTLYLPQPYIITPSHCRQHRGVLGHHSVELWAVEGCGVSTGPFQGWVEVDGGGGRRGERWEALGRLVVMGIRCS